MNMRYSLSDGALGANWLADVIRTETCAFLCGAGASVLSGFPTSWDFIGCLVDGLIRSAGNQIDVDQSLRQVLSAQRLEYVLQVASQTPGVDAIACLDVLQGGQPNIVHTSVMRCLSDFGGDQGVLLTTNFDCLFEEAGRFMGVPVIEVLVGPNFAAKPKARSIIVTKLHGSLGVPGESGPRQLAATLDSVGRYFSTEAEALLDELLRERTLLVLGYSGNDHYDVMPYLLRLFKRPFRRILWIKHDKSVESGLLRREAPPQPLRWLFRGPNDLYLKADTPSLMQTILRLLNLPQNSPSPTEFPNWRAKLATWTTSLGPRAMLVLGDLLLKEDAFPKAMELYHGAATALKGPNDSQARIKARKNIGTIYTLIDYPDQAIRELNQTLEEETEIPLEAKSAVLLELALAYGRLSRWGAQYAQEGLVYLMQADEAAEAAKSEKLMALARQNTGLFFLTMAQNGDIDYNGGVQAATGTFESAMSFYTKWNDIQRMVKTGQDLAACYIALGNYKEAVRLYTFAAWYARIIAYRDEGKLLRLVLGKVASSAALAVFMGSTLKEVTDGFILNTLGALEVFMQCFDEAFMGHMEHGWSDAKNGIDLWRHVDSQAMEFANTHLLNWKFSL